MLSKFSVKKPYTVVVGVIIVIILGVVSYVNTGVDLLPAMNLPYIAVVTIYPGAAPEEIEKTVTKPVEEGLSAISNVTELTSSSNEHYSLVLMEFKYEADIDKAFIDVNSALDLVDFPDSDLLQDPIVLKINPSLLPIMSISLSKSGDSVKDSSAYLSQIIGKINAIDGVASVSVNGLITNLAYININGGKISKSVISYFEELLDTKIILPLEIKEELRAELASSVSLDDVTPEMLIEDVVEILRDTQQWNEENMGDNIMKYFITLLLTGLEDPDSSVYQEALVRAQELIDNKFILNDNEECKQLFYDFIDQITEDVMALYLSGYIGDIASLISPDILKQLLYAQDFEMPSGSIEQGAISYIVKIGTTINTRSELIDLPVVSFNWAKELSARVEQLKNLLTLMSLVSDGKATFTEGDLMTLVDALYEIYGREEDPEETGIGYGTASLAVSWINANIPSEILSKLPENWRQTYAEYLMENAPAKWRAGFTADWRAQSIDMFMDCFDIYLLEEDILFLENKRDDIRVTSISDQQAASYVAIAKAALPDAILYSLPDGWEEGLQDIYKEKIDPDWGMPAHAPTNDLVKQLLYIFADNMPQEWAQNLPEDWETQIKEAGDNSVIPTFADLLENAISNLDPELQQQLENLFRDRSREDIENYFRSAIGLLELISPEAVTVPQPVDGEIPDSAVYVIDFVKLKQSIDALEDKAVIPFKLGSIADITFLDDSAEQITTLLSRVNGELVPSNAVNIFIEKEPDKSTAEITREVVEFLKQTKKEDSGFNYTILHNDGDYIEFMLNNVISNLAIGGLLAVFILFLFLREIKATLVVGSSIIISVVATFVMMYFAGITLNVVSMGGLALGVGMLVDNSIVIIENIYRMRAQGKNIFMASVQGAKQVAGAIVASTLTTVIVFLPIAFIEGLTKQIFTDMALTISFSLLASLIVALTLVPMATSTFIKKPAKKESKIMIGIKKAYVRSLNFSLKYKIVPLILAAALLGVSVFAVFGMDNELFPDADGGTLTVTAHIDRVAIDRYNSEKPIDEPYLTYDDVVKMAIDDIISETKKYKEIESVGITLSGGLSIGGFNLGEGEVSANIIMVDEKKRSFGSLKLAEELKKSLNDYSRIEGLYTVSAGSNTLLGSINLSGNSQTIKLFGNDLDLMKTEARKIKELLCQKDEQGNIITDQRGDPVFIEGIRSVSISNETPTEEYRIRINKTKANMYGLTVAQVFLQVQSALSEVGVAHTLTLRDSGDKKTDYDVYIYTQDYEINSWYIGIDSQGGEVPVYLVNNRDDQTDTSRNEYFVINTWGKSIYVKSGDKNIFIARDGKIPVTREGDTFSYKLISEDGGQALKYTEESFVLKSDTVYNKKDRVKEFDLLTLGISSADLLDPSAPSRIVPLYKLLDDDCFLRDEEGNILYREAEGFSIDKIPMGLVSSNGYDSINHVNKLRVENINITFEKDVNSNNMSKKINKILEDEYSVPQGIEMDLSEGNRYVDEVFNTLYFVLALAIVLIYLVMVAQFQSLKSPFIIMFTLPLAFSGCIIALLIAGLNISVMALIGLIVLMGIVVNNGIVFVDYCNQMIQNNVPHRMAILRTGMDRLRPILMTALTTIFGLMAMAFDTSESGAMLRPLAVAVIGGLTLATFLTLYIVPVVYEIFNKKAKQTFRTKAFLDKDIDMISSSEVEDMLSASSLDILEGVVPAKELGQVVADINKDIESSLSPKEEKPDKKEEDKEKKKAPKVLYHKRKTLRYKLPVRKKVKKNPTQDSERK